MDLNQFSTVDIVLDKANDNFIQKQIISVGDRDGRALSVQITDAGSVGEVPGLTLNLLWKNESSGVVDLTPFKVVNRATSVFRIDYPDNMLTAGKVTAQIEILHDGRATHSRKFQIIVVELVGQMKGILQKAEYAALVAALAKANQFEGDIRNLDIKKAEKKDVEYAINQVNINKADNSALAPMNYDISELRNKKVDKGGNEQITLAMLSQELKEAITGGSLGVVGEDSVNTTNIVDNAVTLKKIAFNPYQKISYFKTNFDESALGYDEDGNLMIVKDLGAPYHQNKIQFNRPSEKVKVLSTTFKPKNSADSNRVFVGYAENTYLVFNIEQEGLVSAYKVVDGELEAGIFEFNSGLTSAEYYRGFELTLVIAGTNIAIYFNKKLRAVLQRSALFSGAFSSAGLVFRGSDTQYNAHVNNVRYIAQPKKYAHISIDDVNGILKDISDNATTYQSIFDNASLKFYRDLHLKYGAVFSLYLFKIGQSGFDVATVPTKFKNEFTANASWLKFGFHSKNADTDYVLSDGTDLLVDYKATINAIRNFASELSIDTIPRFHAFGAAKAAQIALKNSKTSFDGMYSADDNRENNAGLTGDALALIRRADDYADFQNDLYYVKSETRLDGKTKAQAIEILESCYKDISNNNIYAMFFHEGFDRTAENKETLEEVCKWIFGRGIQFDYPMRNKPVI